MPPESPKASEESGDLLDSKQVAEVLGVSHSTAKRLIATRQLPSLTVGRCRRVPSAAVRSFIAEGLAQQPGIIADQAAAKAVRFMASRVGNDAEAKRHLAVLRERVGL